MKPIKLKISAFGPYAGETPEINFEQFEEKGMFLITGETGSGKTTIFDAICYALFGKASGSHRGNKNLRSEYADPKCESYVDFYFSHQGKNYHVLRKPSFERDKLRGEGTITESGKASFYEEGKPPIEGIDPVNKAVEELLHVNADQFKQIAMISQGEFWELLNADTGKRTEILRTIFQTENYNNIVEKLKKRMDDADQEKSQTENSILQYFKDVVAPEDPVLAEELLDLQKKAAASGSAWNAEAFIDMTGQIISADLSAFDMMKEQIEKERVLLDELKNRLAIAEVNNSFLEKLESLTKEKEELAARKPEIDDLREKLARQRSATYNAAPVYRSWEAKHGEKSNAETEIKRGRERLAVLTTDAAKASETLLAAEAKHSTADSLMKEAEAIARQEQDYVSRDTLRTQIADLQAREEELKLQEEKAVGKAEELSARIAELQNLIEGLKDKPAERAALEHLRDELSLLWSDIEDILGEKQQTWKKHADSLKQKQEKYLAAQNAYSIAGAEKDKAEKQFELNRIGILAAKLKEGEACPVCGSVDHPMPAELPAEGITEKELIKLQDAYEQALTVKNDALTVAEKEKTALEGAEKSIREAAAKCFRSRHISVNTETDDVEEIIAIVRTVKSDVEQKIANTKTDIAQNKEECDRLEEGRTLLGKAQGEELKTLEKEKEENAAALQKTKLDLTEKRTLLESIGALPFDTWEEASKKKQATEEEAAELYSAIKTAEEKNRSAETAVAEQNAEIKTLERTLESLTAREKELACSLEEKLRECNFETVEQMKEFITPDEDIAAADEIIDSYEKDVVINGKQLIQAEKDAEGKVHIDVERLQNETNGQQETVDKAQEKLTETELRIKTNSDRKKNIENQIDTLKNANKNSSTLRKLYNLVHGKTGNGKITLEQYVQATGFDGILRAANKRLLPMSSGQFELYRKDDSLGKRSNTFLDLEVLDHYTGQKRPVGDISGGESFKASLSLALGLSDTIATNMGGVQMDALFIDEGFGTLDEKSINDTMNALLSLSNANKLISIISHRPELKAEIKQQINVTKTRNGSQIEVNLGD